MGGYVCVCESGCLNFDSSIAVIDAGVHIGVPIVLIRFPHGTFRPDWVYRSHYKIFDSATELQRGRMLPGDFEDRSHCLLLMRQADSRDGGIKTPGAVRSRSDLYPMAKCEDFSWPHVL